MTQIVRVYSGSDGESHFEDLTADQFAEIANRKGSGEIMLNQRQSPTEEDYHNAPRLQYVVNLQGDSEYEVSDGTRKRLRPGDILVAEDIEGVIVPWIPQANPLPRTLDPFAGSLLSHSMASATLVRQFFIPKLWMCSPVTNSPPSSSRFWSLNSRGSLFKLWAMASMDDSYPQAA